MEEWRDIVGYEGLYQVSNFGRVKSLPKLCGHSPRPEKILKQANRNCYLCVELWNRGKKHSIDVHRLVAIAFLSNPENKPCVNHIDGDKHNNNVNNLEWCTVSENNTHAYKIGLASPVNKTPIKATNITTGEVKCFDSQMQAARELNCKKTNINACLHGKQKTCKGYKFEYIIN